MAYRTKRIEKVMRYYLILKFSYRSFYIMNWIYVYFQEGESIFNSINEKESQTLAEKKVVINPRQFAWEVFSFN